MKKLKYLVVLLVALLIIPFAVYADDNTDEVSETSEASETTEATDSSTDKKVNLYFFRGEGCSHCAEAEAWFEDTLEKEYGDYFKIVDYEVWYNEDNASLMQKVADARGETAEGVPYIIIGDKSWNGFDTSYEDAIIEQIKKVYAQDVSERYDIMNYLDTNDSKKDSSASDIIALVAIILVVGGVGTGIYFARKSNSNN